MDFKFIEKAENIIFCVSPGAEKTNLAIPIGIEVAKKSIMYIS